VARGMPPEGYYAVLGVAPTATAAELRRAYRQKALEHHPDKNPDREEQATEAFKLVAEAYSVLRDANLRAQYDRSSSWSFAGGGGGSDGEASPFSSRGAMDLFRDVFGEELATELAAGFAQVAGEVRPKVQAAITPLTEALATAVNRCSKSEVVRDVLAAGLGTMAADADVEVEAWQRTEERCEVRLLEARSRLREHTEAHRIENEEIRIRVEEAERRAWTCSAGAWLAFILAPPLAWVLPDLLDLWICGALAFLAVSAPTLRSVQLWKVVAVEQRKRSEMSHLASLRGSCLCVGQQEAQRDLDMARQRLSSARGQVARVQEDLLSAERDGASLGGAVRVGWHLAGKLVRRAAGSGNQHELM